MKKPKITHRLIAGECGVACSTVTRVLTGAQNVAPETRAYILEVAKRLGFHAKPNGRHPVLIAIVYSWISVRNVYDSQLIEMLECTIRAKGWKFVLIPVDSLNILNDWLFSGIISIAYNKEIEKILAEKTNMPIVVINSFPCHIDQIYSTFSDDEAAISKALDYLKQLGHSKIVVFSRTPTSKSFVEKKRYHATLQNMRNQNPENYVIVEDPLQLKSELVLAKNNGYTAGIIMIEMLPFYLQKIFDSLPFRIPDDFSLIAKDIGNLFQYLTPVPTTLEQNLKTLADNAVDMLEQIMDGKTFKIHDVPVENIFKIRDSTLPLRKEIPFPPKK